MIREKIVILDFGSQYAHLIAKRFRMLGYYSEIALPSAPLSTFENAKGIVFSGGPASIYDKKVPKFNSDILNLDIPILGLCYGHYVVQTGYNGEVKKAKCGEFGLSTIKINKNIDSPLFENINEQDMQVWMSHQDEVTKLGEGFEVIGSTKDCLYAATQNLSKKRFSLQFHCEVKDTPKGNIIFSNFAKYCGMEKNWDQDAVLNIILENIKNEAKDKKVLLFLSGGVDSTVCFALLNKALGKNRVLGLHIDNGFMRKNESENVLLSYKKYGFNNFIKVDASSTFLKAIEGVTDPQEKRMRIGETFIKVRDEVFEKQNLKEDEWLLAQGTLYPDIIESGGTKNSITIKTHHNRVQGIQELISKGLIIEPIKELYKDEVRLIGKKIGLSDELVMRHPFPGPGLSINVLCSKGKISKEDKDEIKKAEKEFNNIPITEFCDNCTANMERLVLPVRSVGVQGDFRTYRFPYVLSFAKQEGGFFHIPKKWEKIERAMSGITNVSKYTNRTLLRLYQNPNILEEDMTIQEGYCTKERLDLLREVDNIVLTELHKSGYYDKIFQHLTILLPYSSSKDRCSFVLRPVVSEDVMTARFAHLPLELLDVIMKKIVALPFVDALYYDCTNKPPATFGWE